MTKKYNLRSSKGQMNYNGNFQVVNPDEAEFTIHVKAGDWNCISKHLPAVFHNCSYVLGDDQQYSP